jgi:hypothetical protein
MRYPPRLAHLATRAVVVAKLVPTYAAAHAIDDDEARTRLDAALTGGALLADLLASTWESLQGGTKRLTEDGLLEKVAKSLQDRPLRPGRKVEASAGWSAFLVLADLAAGTASEAARRVLETEAGQTRARAGLAEVGGYLARELTR